MIKKDSPPEHIRVLGIIPSSRGFGFAVMEGKNNLVDWGVKPVKGGDKNARSLSNAANLIAHYRPNVIAIEDTQGSRRSARVKALTKEIVALALDENIQVKQFSRKQVNLGILQDEQGEKHALAKHLAACFPEELDFRLPEKRLFYKAEQYQMDYFDAVALAQHCLRSKQQV
jgi:Holliday junction resolvasome RuvABC endonuclease subunit